MNAQELKEKYYELYEYMAQSKDPANMKAFGKAMTEMFIWFADNKPEIAMEWLDKLCSIEWEQYLTKSEAEKIVSGMKPKAPWTYDAWSKAMDSLELEKEEEPFYNEYALFAEMNKNYSDHAETMAEKVWMKPLQEIPADVLVKTMYAFSLDNLRDKDEVYNIRDYFHV